MKTRFLLEVDLLIKENYSDSSFGVKSLCEMMHLSQPQLYRKIKKDSNFSSAKYITHFRLSKAYDLLDQQSSLVNEVAYNVGFSDPAYFSRVFKKKYGYPPSHLLKKMKNE